jgi:transposase
MVHDELTDEKWAKIEPLLPPLQSGKRGHPYTPHRPVLNGICWVLRSGARWADIPERFGPHQTCYDRFRRWDRTGLWKKILSTLQQDAEAAGDIDWEHGAGDATTVDAHQHAAGARHQPAKADLYPQKRGRKRSIRQNQLPSTRLLDAVVGD